MSNEIQFILYQLPDDEGKIQVVIKDETIWATQKAMAQLFDVGVPDISKHLKKKFETGELDKEVVVSKMEIATPHGAIDGKTQMSETAFYNLDAIIAVGYRVSSARATKFRKWATKVLTAPEIIYTRADHTKDHMGLQTWKNAPDGRVLLSDTKVAKNYLPEVEIRRLERAVSGYFDYIEDLIERENAFSMAQFAASVNEFLTFRRYALLPDKGKICREQADCKAEEEYKLFNPTQQIDSDFDKEVRGVLDGRS
ncbi:MAG: virulence RhuM family protein [Prevotella sp.]|nr:virulence RhuM family protein [Prevotella sp.]MBR7049195.1 virulence RhuM family protein [Prevotella sp.]